jgi:hypothetical protein
MNAIDPVDLGHAKRADFGLLDPIGKRTCRGLTLTYWVML